MTDTVLLVSALVAIACANAAVWWLWGRSKAAEVRHEREIGNGWRRWASHFGQQVSALSEENKRLAAEVERLAPGEVVARLHERMGDQP